VTAFVFVAAATAAAIPSPVAAARAPLRDAPVAWLEDDRRPEPAPAFREPEVIASGIEANLSRPFSRLLNPSRWIRGIGTLFGGDHVAAAADINALDEVYDSTWFTNRIGLYPLTAAELYAGPGGDGPSRAGRWTIVGAKTGGVSAGFLIEDASGDRFLIKFDPPEFPEVTTRAAAVSNRILYAIGFNVPQDHAVAFTRDQLVVGDGVEMSGLYGVRISLTEARLDSVLASTSAFQAGCFHALASRYLTGDIVGPFDYAGRRGDDANDRIDHEDRRSLRALRLFAAWIEHTDTKMQNSLDVYVGAPDAGYVTHYLIDLASTLGAQAGTYNKRFGYEYVFDPPVILRRTVALGFDMPDWPYLERPPGLTEVGYFHAVPWDPRHWKPQLPNSAFANLTDRDGYWAAKIVSAFDDAALRAVVAAGHYRDPAAADYVTRILAERRDKLVRIWFDRVPPVDFFRVHGDAVVFADLGVERGVYPAAATRYRVRCAAVDAERRAGHWTDWQLCVRTAISLRDGAGSAALAGVGERRPFLAVQVQVDRGHGWSAATTAYVAPASGRVVALDR
jgi:hypothetical protein